MLVARPSRLRCAFCRDDLGRDVLTCPGCRTLLHEACELDACPTLGCGSLAPWELLLPPRPWATLFALWLALCLITGSVTVLVLFWPSEAPRAGTRPPARPDPDAPELDPWFWWAPGSEVVVRTRIHDASEHHIHMSGGCGPDREHREWTEWHPQCEDLLDRFRVGSRTEHDVNLHVQESCRQGSPRTFVGRLRFDQPRGDEDELLEERANVSVTTPAGSWITRYRRVRTSGAPFRGWRLEGEPYTAYAFGATDVVEETWTDPRFPLPLRRLATWREPEAPPELQTCSLESVVVSIRGP